MNGTRCCEEIDKEIHTMDVDDVRFPESPGNAWRQWVALRSAEACPDYFDTPPNFSGRKESSLSVVEDPVQRRDAHLMARRNLVLGDLLNEVLHAADPGMELANNVNNLQ
jgi:hypothetical protein